MGTYESKSDVPQNIRKYLETVSQTSFNDISLIEINDYLYHLEDWIDNQNKKLKE